MKKGAYNEKMKGLGQSDISVITFHNQPKKATEEAKFWNTIFFRVVKADST